MADVTIKAAYASLVEDEEEGFLFIGFAEGEAEDEPYVLFRQALNGGPVWCEVSDESFGAEDGLERVTRTAKGLEIRIRPEASADFGFAREIGIRIGPDCEDAAPALEALREMLGPVWAETAS